MFLPSPELLVQRLVGFIRDELASRGFDKAVVGLSGGVDSAVVARLCQLAIGERFKAILMPASSSSPESLLHARLLCERFNISYQVQSIAPFDELFRRENPSASPHRIGNACARFRMIVLYDIALAEQRLVVGTGNRSEILLGYETLHGDSACAFNPIGELYKSEIFTLARFLGIPEEIVGKAPSADLFEGQSDEGDLGFSYNAIDEVLFNHFELGFSREALVARGFEAGLVKMVLGRVERNRFKSEMPPLAPARAWIKALEINHTL